MLQQEMGKLSEKSKKKSAILQRELSKAEGAAAAGSGKGGGGEGSDFGALVSEHVGDIAAQVGALVG